MPDPVVPRERVLISALRQITEGGVLDFEHCVNVANRALDQWNRNAVGAAVSDREELREALNVLVEAVDRFEEKADYFAPVSVADDLADALAAARAVLDSGGYQ